MDIRVGAKIVKEKTTNQWVMSFRNMSGDGDHYEIVTKSFGDPPSKKDLLTEMLNTIAIYTASWRLRIENRYTDSLIMEEVNEVGTYLKILDPMDLYTEIVGFDIYTDGDNLASPQELWISWFDRYGDENLTELLYGPYNSKCFMGRINESNFKEILDEQRYILEDRS
jgi:hypothetical protein